MECKHSRATRFRNLIINEFDLSINLQATLWKLPQANWSNGIMKFFKQEKSLSHIETQTIASAF